MEAALARLDRVRMDELAVVTVRWDEHFQRAGDSLNDLYMAAMNAIAFADWALAYFRKRGFIEDFDELALHMFGAFNAATVQQRALLDLFKVCCVNRTWFCRDFSLTRPALAGPGFESTPPRTGRGSGSRSRSAVSAR